MTNYETLKQLLNDTDLQRKLTDHLNCDKVRLNLYEEDDRLYVLDLRVINALENEDVVLYTETFEFKLTSRDSIDFFIIQFDRFVSPSQALETAKTGQIIESHLDLYL